MLSKKQLKYLRTLVQTYKATVQVGKYGITPGTLQSIDENLALNGLTKIHLLNNTDLAPKDAAQSLAEATGSEVVQVVGRVIVLFRQTEDQAVIVFPE